MTDVQIFTIAHAISTSFLAVFLGVFLNNNRLNDVKDVVTARIEANGTALRLLIEERQSGILREAAGFQSGISKEFADLRVLIEKNHSETLGKFSAIGSRLTRLENERRVFQ